MHQSIKCPAYLISQAAFSLLLTKQNCFLEVEVELGMMFVNVLDGNGSVHGEGHKKAGGQIIFT